ncbi:GNAT family N-acetyltransferase [Uliginosibacterium sp. H3]|uniref:GNAT family N-acetyltransferase n=1 Tax=Uliginosibacterium silvisoli TaxID=3114758 RepID=A0ABU6K8P0_9RHOO|nr:GNAT family N-acetyltransferase [Uliginosibacterium sp. H3]
MDEKHYLSPLFEPQSVAIIGATVREGALGYVLIGNMLASGYKGTLYAVNPKYKAVQGVQCYRRIGNVPPRVDLAIIATPADTVPGIIDECGKAGVRFAVVLSAGFGENGAAGARLEMQAVRSARRYGLRLLGPNSLGVARPEIGLNATFAHGKPIPGSIGFISQSGSLCAAILDYARPNQVGFSNVVSLGLSSDLDFGEILDYMVWDFRTESILLYIEGIRDARRFLSALRAAARAKPVLILKVGRHPVGLRAAQQHTGAVAGDDAVFDAALRRAGVIRLYNLSQLYAASKALFAHFRPRGNRLAIITNGGGPGVMAADRAGDLGIPLAQLSTKTLTRLDKILPPHWSLDNPIDLIGDSDPERYANALAALLDDEGVDGVLCLLTPQAMTRPNDVAQHVITQRKRTEKPILTCWLGEDQTRDAREAFRVAGIPSLRTPEIAVELFANLSAYYRNQGLLTQVAAPLGNKRAPLLDAARLLIDNALVGHRMQLLRQECMAILSAFHIPTRAMQLARSPQQVAEMAGMMGFPIVMRPNACVAKIRSAVLIRRNINDAAAAQQAYEDIAGELRRHSPESMHYGICIEHVTRSPFERELMVRVWRDPVLGPVIGFGERSLDPDYWPDRAVALPPLNAYLVRDLVQGTRAAKVMSQRDDMPAARVDLIEDILLRVSEMICELPWIQSLELNPLRVDDRQAVVTDARITIGSIPPGAGRYDHMAIHPYPSDLISHWQLRDGTPVLVRPLKPEDAELEQRFVQGLSPETRYFRFMSAVRELPPALLAKLTQIDYDREIALIATIEEGDETIEIGVCRYATNPDGRSCEFAIVIGDKWQKSGLGRYMMNQLIDTARTRGLQVMKGVFLASNERMLRFAQSLGFVLSVDAEDPTMKNGELDLLGPVSRK